MRDSLCRPCIQARLCEKFPYPHSYFTLIEQMMNRFHIRFKFTTTTFGDKRNSFFLYENISKDYMVQNFPSKYRHLQSSTRSTQFHVNELRYASDLRTPHDNF